MFHTTYRLGSSAIVSCPLRVVSCLCEGLGTRLIGTDCQDIRIRKSMASPAKPDHKLCGGFLYCFLDSSTSCVLGRRGWARDYILVLYQGLEMRLILG